MTKAQIGAVIVGLFALLLATRVVVAYQLPYDRFRNFDEVVALHISEGPLLGLPPMNMAWPGGTIRLGYPLVLLTDLVAQGKALSAAGLLEYLGEVNRQPWHALWVLRWVVMVLSTAGVCSLVVPIARRTGSMAAGLLGTIMLAAVPTFWQLSVMTMPTALSAALLCCSIAAALGVKQDRGRAGWSGLLMGLAAATKITAVQAAPFVALMALGNARPRWRTIATWLALVPVGFALGCPFGVAEPVRMLKAIFGNVVILEVRAGGARAGLLQMADRLSQLMPAWMLILVLGAVAVAVWRRRWWDLLAVSAGLVASGVLVLRSPAFSSAYVLPLAPVLIVFTALTLGPEIGGLLFPVNMLRRRACLTAAVGFAVLVLLAGGREVRISDQRLASYYQGFFDALGALKQNSAGARVIVSPFLVPLAAGYASSDSLLQLADQIESSMVGGRSMGNWLQKTMHLPEQSARVLANHFTEYDRNLASFLRVASVARTQNGVDLHVVGSRLDTSLSRLGALSREEAFEWLRQGKADAMLIDAGMETDLPAGGRLFGTAGNHQYMLYSAAQTGQVPTE